MLLNQYELISTRSGKPDARVCFTPEGDKSLHCIAAKVAKG